MIKDYIILKEINWIKCICGHKVGLKSFFPYKSRATIPELRKFCFEFFLKIQRPKLNKLVVVFKIIKVILWIPNVQKIPDPVSNKQPLPR